MYQSSEVKPEREFMSRGDFVSNSDILKGCISIRAGRLQGLGYEDDCNARCRADTIA